MDILLNAFIWCGLLAMLVLSVINIFMYRQIGANSDNVEKLIRGASFIVGFFIYQVTQVFALPVIEVLMKSLTNATPFSGITFISGLIPTIGGGIVSWYFLRQLKKRGRLPGRIMLLISGLLVSAFINTYVVAKKQSEIQYEQLDSIAAYSYVDSVATAAVDTTAGSYNEYESKRYEEEQKKTKAEYEAKQEVAKEKIRK
jgi:hypothetical protein